MPPGFEPKSGSVKPKQPTISPEANLGRNLFLCSSLPYFHIGYITRDDCTEAVERKPESQRSNSCIISPYEI